MKTLTEGYLVCPRFDDYYERMGPVFFGFQNIGPCSECHEDIIFDRRNAEKIAEKNLALVCPPCMMALSPEWQKVFTEADAIIGGKLEVIPDRVRQWALTHIKHKYDSK